jgi:hypothetical protein
MTSEPEGHTALAVDKSMLRRRATSVTCHRRKKPYCIGIPARRLQVTPDRGHFLRARNEKCFPSRARRSWSPTDRPAGACQPDPNDGSGRGSAIDWRYRTRVPGTLASARHQPREHDLGDRRCPGRSQRVSTMLRTARRLGGGRPADGRHDHRAASHGFVTATSTHQRPRPQTSVYGGVAEWPAERH